VGGWGIGGSLVSGIFERDDDGVFGVDDIANEIRVQDIYVIFGRR
jgi:hypothetical protein